MSLLEEPFFFECKRERLLGVVALPSSSTSTGVLIIVGGPQYRVGSHRQFVLLARELASGGISSMRFDFRGTGDATGQQRTYEDIDPDIAAAIEAFFSHMPRIERVVLWGLCGAASAALFYAYRDPRVVGLVLVNPWVRTEEGIARTYLLHYYLRRLFDRQFWRQVMRGDFDALESARSLAGMIWDATRGWRHRRTKGAPLVGNADEIDRTLPLPARMAQGLERFAKDVLIILSSNDYTAQEFRSAIAGNAQWDAALARNRVSWHYVEGANHTFATTAWRDEVAAVTLNWVRRVFSADADE
jgi:exosortase A-associated hydrolase 1